MAAIGTLTIDKFPFVESPDRLYELKKGKYSE